MARRILACLFCIVLVMFEYAPARAESPSSHVSLLKNQQTFAQYTQDFLDFAKGDEYQPSFDLSQVASQGVDLLNSAATLVEVYDNLSCPQDRTAARAVIQREFVYYSKQLGVAVKTANLGISQTQKPGVAAEGAHMRDDLRQLQGFFDSIKLD